MTKKEFSNIAVAIRAAYPNTIIMADKPSVDLWYKMLSDIDYKVAQNAVLEYISTNKFAPTIAEIREEFVKRIHLPVKSFDDAWGDVRKAIARFGREKPLEAYATMDELTVAVVKNIGWRNLCMSENQDTIRANFRMAYEIKVNEQLKKNKIPQFVEEQRLDLMEQYINVPKLKKMED